MHSEASAPPPGLAALWGVAPAQQRGPAPKFTVADIAAAAVGLADEQGLAAVTLQAVAARLALTTTALYRYVASKDVLLELMADEALGAPPALADLPWRESAAAWARALRGAYLAHPWLALVPASGPPRRPGPYAWLQALVPLLDGATPHRPAAVALMLDCLVRGYAGVGAPTPPEPWLAGRVSDRFPTLASTLSDDWTNPDEEFEEALQALLRGLDDDGLPVAR